jgi:hypothetical protein
LELGMRVLSVVATRTLGSPEPEDDARTAF